MTSLISGTHYYLVADSGVRTYCGTSPRMARIRLAKAEVSDRFAGYRIVEQPDMGEDGSFFLVSGTDPSVRIYAGTTASAARIRLAKAEAGNRSAQYRIVKS